jgi:PilZ domain.
MMEGMPRSFLHLLPGNCRHEFAWPRKTADGEYYQVCLICGEEYRYDWRSMTRLGKRTEKGRQVSTAATESVARHSSWSPRARRLKSPIAVQLRLQGESDLRLGTIENISQSGLFLKGENLPAKDAVLEMFFEMPIEISGQHNARVLCMGKIVRTSPATENNPAGGCAVAIIDYHFLHDQRRKQPQSAG